MTRATDNPAGDAGRIAVSQETAARMLEVTARTLRNWERDGLIAPEVVGKKDGKRGVKRYRVSDLRRLVGEVVTAAE